MDYRLNKIDPEVRHRVEETTKPGKIHSRNSIKITEDKQNKKSFDSELKKQKEKDKKLLVDAVLEEHSTKDSVEEKNMIGSILDIRK